jgi:BMFP domain-containing protein YqiC
MSECDIDARLSALESRLAALEARLGPNADAGDLPLAQTAESLPARFTRFWRAYPKKAGKQAALKAWRRLQPTEQDVVLMEAKLAAPYDYWPGWADGYIPDPVNWLNDGRWTDEPAPRAVPLSAKTRAAVDATESIRQMIRNGGRSLTDGQ